MPATADLLDKAAIAHLAGTSPGQVDTWRFRPLVDHPPFPEPAAHFGGRPVWLRADVAAWLAIPRATGRPRKRA